MIQRIQTLYLLVSAILQVVLWWVPFGTFTTADNVYTMLPCIMKSANDPGTVTLWGLMGFLILGIGLNLTAIFMYHNRNLQNRLNTFQMIFALAMPGMAFFYVSQFSKVFNVPFQYGSGFVLPILSLLFTFLAFNAIRKDTKLVKSLDRIR
ncbi:MAG: hypothetical protein RIS47_891 [Bacteroidota bacterium]|jgi:hypothetical protein